LERTSVDQWNRYYEVASRRRRKNGGDPLTLYRKQQAAREKLMLAVSTVAMGVAVLVFYAVLIR
jgi:type II secretory pathway component PulM